MLASITPEERNAVAPAIEERNAARAVIDRLPANADRSNQAAIRAYTNELSR